MKHAPMGEEAEFPETLQPVDGEASVLSLLLVDDGGKWVAAAGSLLTGSREMASTSWRRWRELQPRRRDRQERQGFDIGPNFYSDPFPSIRILRTIVEPGSWSTVAGSIRDGQVPTSFGQCELRLTGGWTSIGMVGRDEATDTHRLVAGVMRPVSATFAALEVPHLPPTESSWYLQPPFYLPRGPDLGRIFRERNLYKWPEELLGIDWLGGPETPLPVGFAIGRVHEDAWIADVTVDHESEELHISIAWDANLVDPLSCSVAVRAERDGRLLLSRQIRISDLPSDEDTLPDPEPRLKRWTEKLLGVHVPRGPRGSEWGVTLIGPDGALLDERPVARRVESVAFSIGVKNAEEPFTQFTVGDRKPPPTRTETDEAVAMVSELEREANRAAAQRRIASGAELATYLRWRFSYRDGELLILDPYLFNSDRTSLLAFLEAFDRQIRVLTAEIRQPAERLLARTPWLEARQLPKGVGDLHDRVWIVGATALLVGTSVATLMADNSSRTTSASELSAGDADLWREQFETWWTEAGGERK